MSLSSKYKKCGCPDTSKRYGAQDSCGCKTPVAQAPGCGCVSHDTIAVPGYCLRPTATQTVPEGPFYLRLEGVSDEDVPFNIDEVFFYHPVAGLLNIHSFEGGSFEVSLRDPLKVNSVINKDDCVIVHVSTQASLTISNSVRCLCSKFKVPATGETETIYIHNGTGIPTGSTLTFTYQGSVGSYSVDSFDSNDGLVFAYTIRNDGSGHDEVGSIIDGGDSGACLVPIELSTDVDICNASNTTILDGISGCKDGSPRLMKATTEGQVAVSNTDLEWELQRLSDTDCCVNVVGCAKFKVSEGCEASDIVVLQDPVPGCWADRISASQSEDGQPVPINIDGVPFVVLAYTAATRTLTLAPRNEDIFEGMAEDAVLEYPEGQQICFGECCNACNQGNQITDHNRVASVPGQKDVAPFAFDLNDLTFTDGEFTRYLIGIPKDSATGLIESQLIDATFNDDPDTGGPLSPKVSDNLMIRQKICNTSVKGCNQIAEVEFNTELSFGGLQNNPNVRVHYEWAHFAAPSATLADGETANPFTNISAQASLADCIQGPTSEEAEFITDTAIAAGGSGNRKRFPFKAGTFKDYIDLARCDCALSIVWLYVNICLLYTSPSPRDATLSRMPSSA